MNSATSLLRGTVVGIAAFSLLLAGCGSDERAGGGQGAGASGAATSVVDGLKADLDKAQQVPVFDAEAAPIDVPSLRGRKVFNVPLASTPENQAIKAAMEAVAKKAGIQVTTCENRGENAQLTQCLDQALATKQDVVVLQADPAGLGPQLQALKKAGVPVLSLHYFPEGTRVDDAACKGCSSGVTAVQPAPVVEPARIMAEWVIGQGGKVNALIPMIAGLAPTAPMQKAMEETFQQSCPACKFKMLSISVSDVMGAGYQTAVSSALNADPGVNYVISQTDFLLPATLAALKTTGRDQVKIVSRNGTPDALSMIAKDQPLRMDVGESATWIGYAAMDNAFRLMLGKEANPEATPFRAWTAKNVAEAGNPPSGNEGYGAAFVDSYYQLWGL